MTASLRAIPVLLSVLCLAVVIAGAQQIYRWTDENGNVHFGNQPPHGVDDLTTTGRKKSDTEIECEAEVREQCRKLHERFGRWADSKAFRRCMEGGREKCAELVPRVVPTVAEQRFISTPAVEFDPELGDTLECEMRCRSRCRGKLEIRGERALKTGQNYGAPSYSMKVKPAKAGTAYCSVTSPGEDVVLTLQVLRDGIVTARVEGQ